MYCKKSEKDTAKFKCVIVLIIAVSLIIIIGFGVNFFAKINRNQRIEQEVHSAKVHEVEQKKDAEEEVIYKETEEIGKPYKLCEYFDEKENFLYKTTYDKESRQLSYVDAKGLEFQLVYDTYGNLLHRLEYSYNESGKTEQKKINLFHYVYDEKGRMTEKTEYGEPNSEHENTVTASYKFEYDEAGNQIKEYSYNAEGELRSEEDRIYDAEGVIKSAYNKLYIVSTDRLFGYAVSKYDEAGMQKEYLRYNGKKELIYSQKNRYEQDGRIQIQISETYADSSRSNAVQGSFTTKTEYDYDFEGNIAAEYVYKDEELQYSHLYELDEDGNEWEYSYDGSGKLMWSVRTKYLE